MKILQIRFQNLNSLAGIWHIDFTDPSYGENSLFAITGPTGSGKSTLLDAVCLALYGRTPRLSRISKTSNEIMSRRTGICFAEVEFETVKGHFRCHWSQHRSRQQAGGDLQQPKHEIADAATSTILESRIRNVAIRVEEVTGMDFDRFTRSTLLAQGGFATFLQAAPDDRAPLLEQITGTEIYSRLSIKVHELRTEEQAKLQELKQTLAHINLLSSEEEQELHKIICDREQQSELHKRESAEIRKKLDWLNMLTELRNEIKKEQRQLQGIREEEKEYATELKQLPLGLAARELEPVYLEHEALVSKQRNDITEIKRLTADLDDFLRLQKIADKDYHEGEQKLKLTERERNSAQQLIKQVQELDLRLQTAKEQLHEHDNTLKTLSYKKTIGEDTLKTLRQKLELEENRKKKLHIFFKQQGSDEKLGEEFSALQMEINSILHLQDQCAVSSQTRKNAEQETLRKKQTVTLLVKEETTLQKKVTDVVQILHGLRQKSNQLLQGRNVETLQQDLFFMQTRGKAIEDLLLLFDEHAVQTQEMNTLHRQVLQAAEEETKLKTAVNIIRQEIISRQQEVGLLENNMLLLARIQSLEAERHRLQDGSPCPLCGATTHPYSQETIPAISDEELRLQVAKKELSILEKKSIELTRQEIISREQQNTSNQRINSCKEELAKKEKILEQLLSSFEFSPFTQIDLEEIKNEKERLIRKKKSLQQCSEDLKELHKRIVTAEENEKELNQAQQNLTKSLLTARHQVSSAEQEQQRLLREEQILFTELKERTNALFAKLTSYNIDSPSLNNLPAILKELGRRTQEWKNKTEEERLVATHILTLSSEISHQQELLTKLTTESAEKEVQRNNTLESLNTFAQTRADIFGSKNTDEEENRLESAIKEARTNLQQLNKKYTAITDQITVTSTLLKNLESVSHKRLQEIQEKKVTLDQFLTSSPFSDLNQFLGARLKPQILSKLLELQNDLQTRKIKTQTLLEDKETTLHKVENKQLCQEKDEELKQKLVEQENQIVQLLEQAGAAREKLKKNDTDREKVSERQAIIETQKKVTGRWNRLHMLIGSADGKKFRNFAQGLTFDMMINHANNALSRMNNRYILLRDRNVPLDLNVIDTYQAGEVRSTKNLSGGEAFLVSLSLAMGLSHMASNNVRIDSLFLDEGFGTLDEDTLESALDALSQLREDNKLIGVISHVGALKERIPLQIEITPGIGGRSTAKGPGVRREN